VRGRPADPARCAGDHDSEIIHIGHPSLASWRASRRHLPARAVPHQPAREGQRARRDDRHPGERKQVPRRRGSFEEPPDG
jgi:hypothetical protein